MRHTTFTNSLAGVIPLLLVLMTASAGFAGSWDVDPAHSAAHFSIRHMMVSQVRGMFPDVQGTIDFNGDRPTAFDIIIPVGSISTGVADRDTHLKSDDFFAAKTYPIMTFKSANVEPGKAGYKVTGTMTIKGVSRPIELTFTGLDDTRIDPWKNTRRGGTALFKLDRRDYGVDWNAPLDGGGFMVGNTVDIAVDIEVVQGH